MEKLTLEEKNLLKAFKNSELKSNPIQKQKWIAKNYMLVPPLGKICELIYDDQT